MARSCGADVFAHGRHWISCAAYGVVAFLAGLSGAMAQSTFGVEQLMIVRTVLKPDGYLTENDHKKFWAPLRARLRNADDMAAFGKKLDLDVGGAIKFQREVWKSIELSQRAGKVTKTREYESAKDIMLSTGLSRQESLNGIDEAERMFVAVANKTAYRSKQGPMYLGEEQVQKVLSGLDSTIYRLRRLTDPNWSTAKNEYSYPAARLKILSECPWRLEFDEMTIEGKKLKSARLTYSLGENETVIVGFMPSPTRLVDPSGTVTRIAQSSLQGMGISGVRPIVSDWRGRKSATGQGSVKTSQGTMNATIRVVEGGKAQGAWSMIAGSAQSLPDAINLLANVEESVMLD